MEPDPRMLEDLVNRVKAVVDPVRIILFGSAARGQMRADSDLDILVVARPGIHRRRTAQDIYENLIGFGAPVDVVVATTNDLERFGSSQSLVYYSAVREGKSIYVA